MADPTVRLAVRHPALRRMLSAKVVWVYLAAHLRLHAQQPIKIGRTAALLGIKRRTMRRAMRALVTYRYLDCVVPPTAGTPGEYVLGPRAFAKASSTVPRPTGASAAPAPEDAQLTLLPLAS